MADPKDKQDEVDEVEEAPEATEEKKPKRRGSSETTTKKAKEPAQEAPRDESGAVVVRAHAKYVRSAPRKARLVMDHIRGKSVGDARATLQHTPRAVATDISKLLESAVANAENNFELDPDDLHIGRATVDEGPTIKRFRPRAQGRATRINKRTSHMSITLTLAEQPARPAAKRSVSSKEEGK
jgi:ribosomal protein L22